MKASTIERFEDKFIPEPNSGFWLWVGSRDHRNYGKFWLNPSDKLVGAHRASWILYNGIDPRSLCVLHRCDNPPCVNPEHLFLGSYIDNAADCKAKGRLNQPSGMDRVNAKLTNNQVAAILHDTRYYHNIANEYGVSKGVVASIKQGKRWRRITAGVRDSRGRARGEQNGNSRMTAELVIKIRADTRSSYRIAKECGFGETTVRSIKLGRSWRHIL